MAVTNTVTVRLSGDASDMLSMFSSSAEAASETADKIGSSFMSAASGMQEAMSEASARIQAALAEVSSGDLSADEVQAKFAELGTSIDATIGGAMDKFSADVGTAMASATASTDAFKDKYASAMLQLETATKASNDAMKESNDSEDVSKGFEDATNSAGNLFSKLGNLTGSIPIVGEAFKKMGENLAEAESSGQKVNSVLSDLGKVSLVSGAAIGAGVAAESIKAASAYQQSTASLAASAGITTQAAASIGKAFLDTAGTTTFSAQKIDTAYAGVAAQLAAVNGKALDSKQAMTVMSAAMDLAEGSGTDLGTSAKTLASVMQSFGLKTKDAASTSDILFTASQTTGQSVSALGSTLDRVKTKLGGMSPPISALSGLLVDMTDHGETGRAAMSALSSTFTAFLKPSADVATAQKNLEVALDALPPSLRTLAQQYQAGQLTATSLTAAEDKMSSQQDTLFGKFTAASAAVTTANDAQAKLGISATTASGQLKPMGDIIGQLQQRLAGLTTGQAIAQLTADGFSGASAKLVAVIKAGPAAYEKSVAAVTRQNAAHEAAEKQAATLHGQMEKLSSTLEDYAVKIGNKLIPIITKLSKVVSEVIGWFEKHKAVAEALAGVIGGALTVAIGAFAVNTMGKMVKSIGDAGKAFVSLAEKLGIFQGAEEETAAVSEETGGGLGPIGIAIGGVIIAATLLATHWKEVMGVVTKAAEDAWHFIDTNFIQPIETVFSEVVDFIKAHWELIAAILLAPIAPVIAAFVLFHKQIVGFFEALPGDIESAIGDLTKIGSKIVKDITNGVTSTISTVWDGFTTVVSKIWSVISTVGTIGNRIVKDITNGVTSTISTIWDKFVGLGDKIWSTVVGGVDTIGGKIIKAIVDYAEESYYNIIDVFKSLGTDIWKGIGDLASVGLKIVDSIVKGIEGAGDAILNAIKSHLPGSGIIGSALSVIGLAEGGIVTKPTLAIVGEAGYPEAVIPLKGGLSAGSTGVSSLPAQIGSGVATAVGAGQGKQTPQQNILVNVQTNANAQQIGQEVAWAAKTSPVFAA